MAAIHLDFFQQMFCVRTGVAAPIVYAELAGAPWVGLWWSQVLHFTQTLVELDADSLHVRILLDNGHDAQADPLCGNWAAGVPKQYSSWACCARLEVRAFASLMRLYSGKSLRMSLAKWELICMFVPALP